MKRIYYLDDGSGKQRVESSRFPLTVGGAGADINLEGLEYDAVLAWIGLSDGHAFIQPIDEDVEIFHNHERLETSSWLKSGDQVQIGEQLVGWAVKGDQVFIRIGRIDDIPELRPPSIAPPEIDSESGIEPPPSPVAVHPPKFRKWLRHLAYTMLGVLFMIAIFVVFATPVAITLSPDPDDWSMRGFPPPVPLGERLLATPGIYTLEATREGYYPLRQDLDIPFGEPREYRFDLQELPGRLLLSARPAVPLLVFADDVEAPVDEDNVVELERGLRTVRVETERYLVQTHDIEVSGYGKLQQLNLILQPAWANVTLESEPAGATVTLDEVSIGTTPLQAEIMHGQRQFELTLAGHKPAIIETTIDAGIPLSLGPVVLQPNDGILELNTRPDGATVSVDGKFHGSTPLSLVLSSGVDHRLRLASPGYVAAERTISLDADERRTLYIDLSPEYGTVFVTSNPADATLTVDGKASGAGTQRLRLTTRPHTLTFSKTGYLSQTIKVIPRTDTSQTFEINLKTPQQARQDARPPALRTLAGHEMHLLEPDRPFRMGASRREAGRRANESQRLVELTRAFYLSGTEVSNAQFRQFRPKHDSGHAEGVSLNADKLPAVNVSWDDAARYCNWLSNAEKRPLAYEEKDGKMVLRPSPNGGYRLPTEAEWVYAARVSGHAQPVRYPWSGGYPPTAPVGNFADSQIADTLANVVSGYNDGFRGPAPIASFAAFPKGFHDLGGNVAEWVNDYYAVFPGQAEKLVRDPMGPVSGDHHTVRGSSWRDGSITELRLSYRDYSRGPRDNLGFRIARYADE